MKKMLCCLFAVVCTLAFFTSCEDDKNGNKLNVSYSGKNLNLSFNGRPLEGQKVVVSRVKDETFLSFDHLIPGTFVVDMEITMSPVAKTSLKGATDYAISGEKNLKDGRTVFAKGTLSGAVLSLELVVEVHSPLTGTWVLPEMKDLNGDGKIDVADYNPQGNFFIKVETVSGSVDFSGESIPDALFNIGATLKGQAYLATHLKSITLKKNGYLVVSYSKDGKTFTDSPEGLLSYYVKDQLIYIVPDWATVLNALITKSRQPGELETLLVEGMPFAVISGEKEGEIYATFFLNKKMIDPLLNGIVRYSAILEHLLPQDILQILNQGMAIAGNCKEIEIGVNTVKE